MNDGNASMISGLDPIALLQMNQAQRQAERKTGQADSGFDAMLQAVKAAKAQGHSGNDGVELGFIEPDNEAPADNDLVARLDDVSAPTKKPQLPKGKEDKLSQTALEFEAMLMTQMFQTFRKTVEPSGLFGGNQTERGIYEYLFDQSIFQNAAANGQTWGLASRLEESWREHFARGGN